MPATPTLEGPHLRLEPLTLDHLPELKKIALDPATRHVIWRFMTVFPQTPEELRDYVEVALRAESAGTAMPWATVLKTSPDSPGGQLIGSTRFAEIDLHHRTAELGYTWLTPSMHGTRANTEAKLLQLTYAFEELRLNRVGLKTHHLNRRSQAAIRAIGGVYEGTFRNHYIMPDGTPRDSCWFSIIREDWPEVRETLTRRLNAPI